MRLAIHKSMNELTKKIEAAKKAHQAALKALALYDRVQSWNQPYTVIVRALAYRA